MVKRITIALRNERGAALILALMTVTVLAVFSLTAVITSSQGIHIGSDYRTYQETVYLADGGADFAQGIIRRIMANGMQVSSVDTGNASITFTNTAALANQISGVSPSSPGPVATNPDITVRYVTGDTANINISYLKSKLMPGSSTESAARYEGIGSGTSGGIGIYYRIDSYNKQLPNNVQSTVRANFKCVEAGGRCL